MAQTKAGAIKAAAKQLGLTLEEYQVKNEAGLNWCRQCKTWKPVTEFYKDCTRLRGRSPRCVSCLPRPVNGPTKRERNRERLKGLAWCSGCRTWLPLDKVRRGKCQFCWNAWERKHYAENANYRLHRKLHTMARNWTTKPLPLEAQEMLMEKFEGKCAYCGAPATTWDHIIPISEGGETLPGNVVPACRRCNSSKKAQDVWEWLEETGRYPWSIAFYDQIALSHIGIF